MSSLAPDVTWFRLVIRGIGVLLLALGVPGLLNGGLQMVWYVRQQSSFYGATPDWWWLVYIVSPVAQTGIGLYLLLGARGLINYCCRGALGMCPACNYDVRNISGANCPECGSPLPGRTPAPTPPTSS